MKTFSPANKKKQQANKVLPPARCWCRCCPRPVFCATTWLVSPGWLCLHVWLRVWCWLLLFVLRVRVAYVLGRRSLQPKKGGGSLASLAFADSPAPKRLPVSVVVFVRICFSILTVLSRWARFRLC